MSEWIFPCLCRVSDREKLCIWRFSKLIERIQTLNASQRKQKRLVMVLNPTFFFCSASVSDSWPLPWPHVDSSCTSQCSSRLDLSAILHGWNQTIERLIESSLGTKAAQQSGASLTQKRPKASLSLTCFHLGRLTYLSVQHVKSPCWG